MIEVPAGSAPVRRLAAELRATGGFFHLEWHQPGAPARAPWQEMSTVFEPAGFAERVNATRGALANAAGCEPAAIAHRVAVSLTHLGLVARLVSPVLAAASQRGIVLCLNANQLRWQPVIGGPVPMSISVLTPLEAHDDVASMAAAIGRRVLGLSVAALTALAGELSVSPTVLWGNVASSINGASSMLCRTMPSRTMPGRTMPSRTMPGQTAPSQTAPDASPGGLPVQDLARALLDRPVLTGRHTGRVGADFRRRSCCLLYAIAPGPARPVCGDCVLQPASRSSADRVSAEAGR